MSTPRHDRASVRRVRLRPAARGLSVFGAALRSLLVLGTCLGPGTLADAQTSPAESKPAKIHLQTLVSDRSSLKFVAQIGILQLEGAFRSVTGRLELDRRSENPSLVILTVDPAKVDLQGSQSSTLLQTPGAKPAIFTSSNIHPRAANKFLVQGQVASGDQNYAMEFIAHCPKRSQSQSYCEFKVTGPIPAIGALSGLAATEGSGTLEGKLTFRQ